MGLFVCIAQTHKGSIMEIDTRELKRLELDLLRLNKTGFKIAHEQTMNDLAFETRRIAKENIGKDFTLRNTWTVMSKNNPVEKAKKGKPFAEYGSTLGYMAKREEGSINQPDPYTGAVAIATPVASGERQGGATGKTIRRKVVQTPNRKMKMKMPSKRMKELPRRERNAALIQEAIKSKRPYIEMHRNGETNIFKVKGKISKKTGRFGKASASKYTLHRMYKTEHRAIIVKPMPWLQPSTTEAYKSANRFYTQRLQWQLDRMRRR